VVSRRLELKGKTRGQQHLSPNHLHPELTLQQLAAVMTATGRIVADAQIDLSYSPGGANVHVLPI